MKHSLRVLFFGFFLASFAGQISAQVYALSGDGRDFFIGFMLPSYNKVAAQGVVGYYGAYALVSSYSDNNNITVSYFNRQTGAEEIDSHYTIPVRTGIQIPLNISRMIMGDSGDVPEFCSCHIAAEHPINVEFFSAGASAGGSYLATQTLGLGKKYVISSYNDNPGRGGIVCDSSSPSGIESSYGFFEIVAPYDGTNVMIIPNSTTMGDHVGMHSGKNSNQHENRYTVSLRRGQCYLVKSSGSDSTVDISGSIVESNKPVAVLGGHENAFIGGLSGRKMEGRNFMIQEMIPVDNWDTTGYVMIPLKDSQPADGSTFEGVGENYRVYSWDSTSAKINFFDSCSSGSMDMTNSRLNYPAKERSLVTCPVDIEATNGKKFSAMMYDNRNIANAPPYPAPSMMAVVPMSHWRTSYLLYVPANKFESSQAYFANIIAPAAEINGGNGLTASFNGGGIQPIKTVMSFDAQFTNIPNHIQGIDPVPLIGMRFRLSPGSYYVRGLFPFMVYNYGFRGLDPNNDLGDFDCDNYFFSYGSPAGMRIGVSNAHIRVVPDTFSTYWNVCAYDSTFGLSDQGIKSVILFDDQFGDFVQPQEFYNNTTLVDPVTTSPTTEIDFTGGDTNVCFQVQVVNPIDRAYAPLFIVDDNNNAIVFRLAYTPPPVKITPDSGQYLLDALGKDTCLRYVFNNVGRIVIVKVIDSVTHKEHDSSYHTGKSFTFSSANLKQNNPSFKVTGTIPSLPATIAPGDSLVFTACYTARDTVTQRDTIELLSDCCTFPIPLIGTGATPIIIADDHDFGSVLIDSTKCAEISVHNVGNAPLILTKQWLMEHYGVNFTFPDSSLLPMTLNSGQEINLTFCYTPHFQELDTTAMHWGTNLVDPYLHQKKDRSLLSGRGVKTGFVWDRTMQRDSAIAPDSVITRVWLLNNALRGGPSAHVDSVFITGADSSEFYILATQNGRTTNFDLNGVDTIWVDVVFKPNPNKFTDRHANLVASGPKDKGEIITFIGIWARNGVALSPQPLSFTVRPNPASGNSVIVSLASAQYSKAALGLYDILGREVYRKDIVPGISETEIPLRNLKTGVYYIRFSSDYGTLTQKFDIMK